MITTAQEYFEALWRLNDGNVPTVALLLPKEESIYEIDLNDRKIEMPEMLGVETDQTAETIYFICDRFFGNMDLANTSCVVLYKNAKGQYGAYPIPFYDITTFSGNGSYLKTQVSIDTYKPNKFYIKTDIGNYVLCLDEGFNEDQEYYVYYPPEELEDRNFIIAYVTPQNYKKDIYYIKKDNKYEKATNSFNPNETYYSYMEQPKILFPWVLGGRATAAAGTLEYMVQFYKLDNSVRDNTQYLYKLNTKIAKTKILDTMVVNKHLINDETADIPPQLPGWIEDINYKIDKLWKGYPGTDEDPNNDFKGYELYWIEA